MYVMKIKSRSRTKMGHRNLKSRTLKKRRSPTKVGHENKKIVY